MPPFCCVPTYLKVTDREVEVCVVDDKEWLIRQVEAGGSVRRRERWPDLRWSWRWGPGRTAAGSS